MENVSLLEQTAPMIAIVMIIITFGLGIILYLWFQQMQKKTELLLVEMRRNIDNLEQLSQYIYETACLKGRESNTAHEEEPLFPDNASVQLNEHKKQIQSIMEQQAEITQKLGQVLADKFSEQNEIYTSKNKIYSENFPPEEKSKYEEVSELILALLKDLLSEKEQVTAQELVYAMPSQYSLAEIYRSLEMMKESNQIDWEDESIHPQSILKLLKH